MKIHKTEIEIRKAIPADSQDLTKISFAAKKYWNYPDSYYEAWKNELTITGDYIKQNLVYTASIHNEIIGYYSIVNNPASRFYGEVYVAKGYWMEHIFINPEFLYKGTGSILIEHMKQICNAQQIHSLLVFVDPNAVGFYEKTGAVFQSMSNSSIPDREIPVYKIQI